MYLLPTQRACFAEQHVELWWRIVRVTSYYFHDGFRAKDE